MWRNVAPSSLSPSFTWLPACFLPSFSLPHLHHFSPSLSPSLLSSGFLVMNPQFCPLFVLISASTDCSSLREGGRQGRPPAKTQTQHESEHCKNFMVILTNKNGIQLDICSLNTWHCYWILHYFCSYEDFLRQIWHGSWFFNCR